MEFKARPLIRNATPPDKLFDEDELALIKAHLEREYSFQRYGKRPAVKEDERKAVAELLELARFHGYLPDGIGPDGVDPGGKTKWKVKWGVITQPDSPKNVVITIRKCEDCSKQFHGMHYPDMEPPDLCRKCEFALMKDKKRKGEKLPF